MSPTPRPFVHVNIALDEEGRATSAPAAGGSISCRADWRRVHRLREQYDAVAVGGRTWLLDSPRLNVRPERLGRAPLRQPARIIFAGGHRCEARPENRPTFIIGRTPPEGEQFDFLRVCGRRLAEPLAWLRGRGVQSMLVEGGPILLLSFFAENFTDLLTIYVRTSCAEHALAAARRSFAALPPKLDARTVGEGILLTGETSRRAPRASSTRNESLVEGVSV